MVKHVICSKCGYEGEKLKIYSPMKVRDTR